MIDKLQFLKQAQKVIKSILQVRSVLFCNNRSKNPHVDLRTFERMKEDFSRINSPSGMAAFIIKYFSILINAVPSNHRAGNGSRLIILHKTAEQLLQSNL